jgi:hypothetical protein
MAGIPALSNPMRHRLEEQEAMQMHKHYQEALEGWAWPDHLDLGVPGQTQELELHQHLQAARHHQQAVWLT